MAGMAYVAFRKETMPTVIVVGAGWAGLSCAYELAKAKQRVILIEAAPQIGGRARSIKFQDYLIDNGQHIGLGAYHTLRSIIRELGLDERQLFKILPLEIVTMGDQGLHLKLPNLPVPFNLLAGIISTKKVAWAKKLSMLKFAYKLHASNFKLAADCTVLEFLQNYHQSNELISNIWEPIALASMSTRIDKASAQIFCNVLRQSFGNTSSDSNWYLPAVDLSNLLPNYIATYLQQTGNEIIKQQPIKALHFADERSVQVFSSNQSWHANHVVLALSPWQTVKILSAHHNLQDTCTALQQINYEPITTIYFQFPRAVQLPYPMLGIQNSICQWIFDRSFASQPDILSVVITGPTDIKFADHHTLTTHILQEILKHFPHLPTPIASKVICEKRAAFTCDVASQKLRPQARTAVKNLWLSGDYLQNGLPATLEGALLSGKQTAMEILAG